jgi:hypothetical protein
LVGFVLSHIILFFSLTAADEENIREFDLNLTDVEDNVNGFYAFLSEQFIFDGEMIGAVVLHKLLNDVQDTMDEHVRLIVSLMECGTKILVEEPAVPHFFYTHTHQMLAGIGDAEARRAIEAPHVYKMNKILHDPNRRMKKYILNLPSGIKCKMGYMNPSSGRVLIGSMNVSDRTIVAASGLQCYFTMGTITYAIALDTEDTKVVSKNPKVGNEALDYFTRRSSNF